MDTEQFTEQLVDEGAKKPMLHPMVQTMIWLAGTIVYFAVIAAYDGVRPDVRDIIRDPYFLSELVLLLVMGASAALAALCLSRPDAHQKPWIKIVPFVLVFPWAVATFAGSVNEMNLSDLFSSVTSGQFDCPWHILLFSIPPGIAIFLIVRTGATVQCCWAGTMATWSVAAFAHLLMRLIEGNDNPAHLIVWHVLPVILICLAGMMVGKFALKWR